MIIGEGRKINFKISNMEVSSAIFNVSAKWRARAGKKCNAAQAIDVGQARRRR
jgi:hypothetical protein